VAVFAFAVTVTFMVAFVLSAVVAVGVMVAFKY
jgi:hypothetical protein